MISIDACLLRRTALGHRPPGLRFRKTRRPETFLVKWMLRVRQMMRKRQRRTKRMTRTMMTMLRRRRRQRRTLTWINNNGFLDEIQLSIYCLLSLYLYTLSRRDLSIIMVHM